MQAHAIQIAIEHLEHYAVLPACRGSDWGRLPGAGTG